MYEKYVKYAIDINDYKKYPVIEIEAITVENKYGNFINYSQKNEDYYHIFFNENKKNMKRNYLLRNEDVTKVIIRIDCDKIKSLSKLFKGCKNIKKINFTKFYENDIINMSHMFSECISLTEVNFSDFNSYRVVDMSNMFSGCSSLTELNLSNFKTENVKDMSYMFSECSSLKELNLSSFNMENVTNMSNMFNKCSSLKELNLSNFNTINVTNMYYMFNDCSSLEELDISNFNNPKIKYDKPLQCIFKGCSSLKLSKELKKKFPAQNTIMDMNNKTRLLIFLFDVAKSMPRANSGRCPGKFCITDIPWGRMST